MNFGPLIAEISMWNHTHPNRLSEGHILAPRGWCLNCHDAVGIVSPPWCVAPTTRTNCEQWRKQLSAKDNEEDDRGTDGGYGIVFFICLFIFSIVYNSLISSAVILSVSRGGCYILKTVTPTETRSTATAVSLPSVLRGAGVPVINACPEPSADHVCCAVN